MKYRYISDNESDYWNKFNISIFFESSNYLFQRNNQQNSSQQAQAQQALAQNGNSDNASVKEEYDPERVKEEVENKLANEVQQMAQQHANTVSFIFPEN